MSIKVIKPGLLTTLQDLGRIGYQKFGVIASGAMDTFSLRVANLLVGNEENEAGLEMTILGPTIYFETDALIAICGGDLSPVIKGKPVPQWKAVYINGGSTLKFSAAKTGIRGYLAVAGGFDIQPEMESRSTYLRASIGGFKGRALQEGDVLHIREKVINHYHTSSRVSRMMLPKYSSKPTIRVIKGAQYDQFSESSKAAFFTAGFKVLPQSDRMGYRLSGPSLHLKKTQEFISEAVTFGTVQVPSDGNPIVLMADRQTVGGYPKIAQVISVDLPIIAQLNLGSYVYFQEVSLKEAQHLYLSREKDISLLKQGIRMNNF